MKKMAALLVFLFVSTASFGQIEWVLDNYIGHEYVHKFLKTKDNRYAILHSNNEYCCTGKIIILDSTGHILFNYTADHSSNGNGISLFNDIIEMLDNSLSFTAVYDPDPMFPHGAILNVGTNWGLTLMEGELNQQYDIGATISGFNYILVDQNHFSISMNNYLLEEIWKKWLTGYIIFDMTVKTTDTILVATKKGLLVMDANGNITAEHPSLVFDQIKTNSQDGIIGSKDDSVFLLSPAYVMLNKAGYQGDKVKDFAVEDAMIAVLTASGHVYRYDSLLTPLNDFQLFNEGEFKYITIKPERLVLAGLEQYGAAGANEGTKTIFVKEYSFEGEDFDLSKDIGIVSVGPPQKTQVINFGTYFKVIFENIKVKVKNFGDNPVESLYLRSYVFKSNQYDNLGLGPGEEMELTIPAIERTFPFDPAGLELDFCFWTSHPDLRMDLDAGNDSYCMDLIVANEEVRPQNSFKIYPNLTTGKAHLDAPAGSTLTLYDVLGRQLFYKVLNDPVLDLSGLATGVYWVVVRQADGATAMAGKVVKQ
jgi:hypothetical protein